MVADVVPVEPDVVSVVDTVVVDDCVVVEAVVVVPDPTWG